MSWNLLHARKAAHRKPATPNAEDNAKLLPSERFQAAIEARRFPRFATQAACDAICAKGAVAISALKAKYGI
tara:strand:+ start:1367 stop:1582 length:216 start_codon:yes stop_codon:yes gene_type:complete